MRILVNGEAVEVAGPLSVAELLAQLDFGIERVAVEKNRQLVPRREWEAARVEAGDALEIVRFVGGG